MGRGGGSSGLGARCCILNSPVPAGIGMPMMMDSDTPAGEHQSEVISFMASYADPLPPTAYRITTAVNC